MSAEKHPVAVVIGIVGAAATALAAVIALPRGCSENKKAAEEARLAEVKRLAEEDELLKKRGAQQPRPAPAGPPAPKSKAAVPPPVGPSGWPPAAPPVAPKLVLAPASAAQPKPVVVRDIHARLVSSVVQGDELTCTLVLTSLGAKRTVTTSNGGSAHATFDNAKKVRQTYMEIGGHKGHDLWSGVALDKDVPTEMVVRFGPVPDGATRVALLDLGFWNGLDIAVRDAPLQWLVPEGGAGAPAPVRPKLGLVPATVVQPKAALSLGIHARLESSVLQGDELVCTVILTNTGPKRKVKTANGGSASLTLSNGTKLRHSHMEIGGHKGYDLFSGVALEKDVPTQMAVRFKGVPESAARVALIDLGFWEKLDLTFRDAPVQRLVAE